MARMRRFWADDWQKVKQTGGSRVSRIYRIVIELLIDINKKVNDGADNMNVTHLFIIDHQIMNDLVGRLCSAREQPQVMVQY